MAIDLLQMVKVQITPDITRATAERLGETPEKTADALSASAPALLTCVADVARDDAGTSRLQSIIGALQARHGKTLDRPAQVFEAPEGTLATEGASMLERELGPKSSILAEGVAQASGIKRASAGSLLSMMFPLVLGLVGRHTAGMSPNDLGSLLRSQRSGWQRMLPGPLASLGAPPTEEPAAPVRVTTERVGTKPVEEVRAEPPRRSWLRPLAIAALLGIAALFAARALRKPEVAVGVERGAPTAAAPAAPTVGTPGQLAAGTPAYDMSHYLDDTADHQVPKTFTFDNLNFESGTSKLTPESKPTVDSIAGVLRAHPDAKVRLETHTDDVGDNASNLQLSRYRAQVVKEMLASRGVDASRVEAAGYGEERPVAPNDSDANRAKNRRLDVVITKK